MKTTNNVQKTFKNQMNLLMVIALVVISSLSPLNRTASAQEFMKGLLSNAPTEKVTLSMVNSTSVTASNSHAFENSKSSTEVKETEAELKVESWMTNESFFIIGKNKAREEEQKLKLEDWITNSSDFWRTGDSSTNVEVEPVLKVEKWMIDNSKW